MELLTRRKLSNNIIDDEKLRYCEIYKLSNLTNNKLYIGQAVSHILNHKRYRPYGSKGRFKCHISEAFSNKKAQCHYLNSSIKKYGPSNFKLEVLDYCELKMADKLETEYIIKYNSLYPNGYNLKLGGKQFRHTDESKRRVSNGIIKYYENKKFDRFISINPLLLKNNHYELLRPLKRDKIQYGWYIYINDNGKIYKADFGGSHISLDRSKKNALKFLEELAKRLDAGNSLEPITTTP